MLGKSLLIAFIGHAQLPTPFAMPRMTKEKPQSKPRPTKSEGRLKKLFGKKRHEVSPLCDVNKPLQESFRPVGKVNSKFLQGSLTWNVKYLGCILGLKAWQFSANRADFMKLIDEAQMDGSINWFSVTPKLLHISPIWLHVTDTKKKTLYAQVQVSKIGSLAYAEDDGSHVIGFKVADPFDGDSYACHVVECSSEATAQHICTTLRDTFSMLMAQLSAYNQAGVHPPGGKKTSQQIGGSSPLMAGSKRAALIPPKGMSQEDKHKEPIRKQSKQDTGPHHETPPVKYILATLDRGSSDEDSEGKDSFPDVWGPPPAATASVSVSQGPPTTANPGDRRKLSKHDSRTEANFLIDEHFAGLADPQVDVANWPLFTESSPEKQQRAGRRAGRHAGQKKELFGPVTQQDDQDDDSEPAQSSSEDSVSFVPTQKPQSSTVSTHNNNVVEQELPDTTGVEVTFDFNAYTEGARKPRASIMSADFAQLSPTQTKKDLPKKLSPPASLPPSPGESPSPSPAKRDSPMHTPAPTPPPTPPLPTPQEKETEDRQVEPSTDPPAEGPSGGPASPPAPAPPEPATPLEGEKPIPRKLSSKVFETFLDSTPPVLCAPPEKKKKKKRKKKVIPAEGPKEPWPVLVRVDDQPTNKRHAAFLDEVESAISVIEYRQLRREWLAYQKRLLDVIAFARKTKIIFRGDREHFRKGARMLVDEDDRELYLQALDPSFQPAKPKVVEIEETDEESSEEENTAVLKLIKKSEKKVAARKPQPATKVPSFQVSSSGPSVGAAKRSTQPPSFGPSKADSDQNLPSPGTTSKPGISKLKPFQEVSVVKGCTQGDFQPKPEGRTKPPGQISSVMADRLAMFQGGQKGEPERQEAPRRRLVSNAARLFNKNDEDDNDHQEDTKPLPRKPVLSRWVEREKEDDTAPPHSVVKGKQKESKGRSDSEDEHERPGRHRDRRQSNDSSDYRHSRAKKGMHKRKGRKSESESESDGGHSHQKKEKGRKQKEEVLKHTKEPQKDDVVSVSTNATIDVLSQLVMGDAPPVVQPAPVSEEMPFGGDNLLHSLAIQTGLVEPKPDTSLKALEDMLSLPAEPSFPPPWQQVQLRKASTTGQVEESPIQEEAEDPSEHSKSRSRPQSIKQSDSPTVIDIDIGQEQEILLPQRSKKTSLHINSANFFVNLPASAPSESPSIYAPAPLEPLPPPPPLCSQPPPSLPDFVHGSEKKRSSGGGMPSKEVQADRDALLHQIRSTREVEKVDHDKIESNTQQMRQEAKRHLSSSLIHEPDSKQSTGTRKEGSRRSSKHEDSMHPNGEEEEFLHHDHDPGARNEGHTRRDSLSDGQPRTSQDEMEREGGSQRTRRNSTTRQVDNVNGKGRRSSAQPEPDSGGEGNDTPSSHQEQINNDTEDRAAHHPTSDRQHEHAKREPLPPPQPVALDEEDEDLPEWKQKLLYQKRLRATAEVRAKKQAERDEEERFLGVPEWKVKLIKKKEAEKAVLEESEREQQAERHERLTRIASMPEWKKKLYMAKNPLAFS